MYQIHFSIGVHTDLKTIPIYYRKRILDTIEKQLTHRPTAVTRNKKILINLTPPWETISPIWELRIEDYRVFYDIDEQEKMVVIRAIRHKPPEKTTEEIL